MYSCLCKDITTHCENGVISITNLHLYGRVVENNPSKLRFSQTATGHRRRKAKVFDFLIEIGKYTRPADVQLLMNHYQAWIWACVYGRVVGNAHGEQYLCKQHCSNHHIALACLTHFNAKSTCKKFWWLLWTFKITVSYLTEYNMKY